MKGKTGAVIVAFEAENVKKLKVVRIVPPAAGAVIVAGENEQGKSAVLDSVEYAFCDGRALPLKPIREGEKRAVIKLDMGEFIITRIITPSGSRLEITNADGTKVNGPQAMLDGLRGELSFDPLAFSRYKGREQVDALKKVLGLNFSEVDKEREELYADRTRLGREVKQAEGLLKSFPDPAAQPDAYAVEPVDVAELNDKLLRANKINAEADDYGVKIERLRDAVRGYDDRIAELLQQVEAIRQTKAQHERRIAELQEERDRLETVPTAELVEQIRNAEKINTAHRAYQARQATLAKLRDLRAEADSCTRLIEDIDREKNQAIQKAAGGLPVPGMGMTEECVTINGIPFEQCSSAQRLKASMAIGLAMNPGIKVMLIRDGSLLDEANMAIVAQMAVEAGAQVWIERVGSDSKATVIMEDGEAFPVGG